MRPPAVTVDPQTRAIRHRLGVAAVLCGSGLLVVALLVTYGWARLVALDERWSSRAYAFTLAHGVVEDVVRVVTNLADGWTVTIITAAVALALATRREWLLGWWLVATVAGSALFSTALKVGLERIRPTSAGELTSAHGFSFPSGHTQAATVTYVSVVLVVGWQMLRPGRASRLASSALVVVVVGAVGLSRIYLGAHWPSDVVGGWLSGSAWVLGATAVLLSLAGAQDRRATVGAEPISPRAGDVPPAP